MGWHPWPEANEYFSGLYDGKRGALPMGGKPIRGVASCRGCATHGTFVSKIERGLLQWRVALARVRNGRQRAERLTS
jgi:hypothetical protein